MSTVNKSKPEVILKQNSNVTAEAVRYQIQTPKSKVEFSIILGDLTQAKVDAIVCPSNGGYELAIGGVQNAIADKAGMQTFNEAMKKAEKFGNTGAPFGFAVSTTSGKLTDLKGIIHVNNMVTRSVEDVRVSVVGSLWAADESKFESVAFPAMGTGIWGMSYPDSLKGTLKGIEDFFKEKPESSVKKVGIVVYARPSIENATEMQKMLNGILRS